MKKSGIVILSLIFAAGLAGKAVAGEIDDRGSLETGALFGCWSAPVIVTGQTTYYRAGDDGDLEAGVAFNYTDNADGTITDNVTGLTWAKDGNGKGCNWGQQTDWDSAIDYCNSLDLGGFSDWRLPNIRELQSIANYGRYPAVDSTFFPNTNIMYYWSSTSSAYNTNYAWVIYFTNGGVHTNDSYLSKTESWYLRAVRGESVALLVTGQTTSYRTGDDGYYQKGTPFSYTDNGDGTISDNATGLMWARDGSGAGCANGLKKTWDDAIDWANGLFFAGREDWRLPNARELLSLVNYSRQIRAVSIIKNILALHSEWELNVLLC